MKVLTYTKFREKVRFDFVGIFVEKVAQLQGNSEAVRCSQICIHRSESWVGLKGSWISYLGAQPWRQPRCEATQPGPPGLRGPSGQWGPPAMRQPRSKNSRSAPRSDARRGEVRSDLTHCWQINDAVDGLQLRCATPRHRSHYVESLHGRHSGRGKNGSDEVGRREDWRITQVLMPTWKLPA